MKRLIQSLVKRGFTGTARLFVHKVRDLVTYARPAARRTRAVARLRDLELDRTYGLDTDGTDRPPRSDACGDNWLHGHRYGAIDVDACTRTLTR